MNKQCISIEPSVLGLWLVLYSISVTCDSNSVCFKWDKSWNNKG